MPVTRVRKWGRSKTSGSKIRNDPRVKRIDLMELAIAYGQPFRLRDLVKFPTIYAKAWDALVEDGKILCVSDRERIFRVAESFTNSPCIELEHVA